MLANIFAHVVIDTWFSEVVKIYCRGRVELFRYADDAVICCQYESDAIRIHSALQKRLGKYKLSLNEEKTQLVAFSKEIKQSSFDFLGFTFYIGRSRNGAAIPKLKSSGKRLRAKLSRVNQWARMVRNRYDLLQIWTWFCAKLRGHIQYYGMSHNFEMISTFIYRATRIFFKWINRRSQKKSFNWKKFNLYMELKPLPKARIVHRLF